FGRSSPGTAQAAEDAAGGRRDGCSQRLLPCAAPRGNGSVGGVPPEAERASSRGGAADGMGPVDQFGVSIQSLSDSPLAAIRGDTFMTRKTFCGSPLHAMDRRAFLGAAGATAAAFAADMTGLGILGQSALAKELKKQQKRCILLWLAGGAS